MLTLGEKEREKELVQSMYVNLILATSTKILPKKTQKHKLHKIKCITSCKSSVFQNIQLYGWSPYFMFSCFHSGSETLFHAHTRQAKLQLCLYLNFYIFDWWLKTGFRVCSCKDSNEPSNSIKSKAFLGQLSNYQIPKKQQMYNTRSSTITENCEWVWFRNISDASDWIMKISNIHHQHHVRKGEDDNPLSSSNKTVQSYFHVTLLPQHSKLNTFHTIHDTFSTDVNISFSYSHLHSVT